MDGFQSIEYLLTRSILSSGPDRLGFRCEEGSLCEGLPVGGTPPVQPLRVGCPHQPSSVSLPRHDNHGTETVMGPCVGVSLDRQSLEVCRRNFPDLYETETGVNGAEIYRESDPRPNRSKILSHKNTDGEGGSWKMRKATHSTDVATNYETPPSSYRGLRDRSNLFTVKEGAPRCRVRSRRGS